MIFISLRWQCLPLLICAMIPSVLSGKVYVITTGDGNGADAYSNSEDVYAAYGYMDPKRLLVSRDNAKAYLRFDLQASGKGTGSKLVTWAKLSLQQIGNPIRRGETLEIFGLNQGYPFRMENRLGDDWTKYLLTHATAPASGAGGSVSVANSRTIKFGNMVQSDDGVHYYYKEDDSMELTPFLDYLNGTGNFSKDESSSRVIIVAESADQARHAKYLASAEAGEQVQAPTLEIRRGQKPVSIWWAYESKEDYRISPHGWLYEKHYPIVWFYSLESWVSLLPALSTAEGWYGYAHGLKIWVYGTIAIPDWIYHYNGKTPGWQPIQPRSR